MGDSLPRATFAPFAALIGLALAVPLDATSAGVRGTTIDVRLVHIDGTTARGEWIGSPDGRAIEIQTADGRQSLSLDDLSSVTFDPESNRRDTGSPEHRHIGDADPSNVEGSGSPAEEQSGPQATIGDFQSTRPAVIHLADGGRLHGELLGGRREDEPSTATGVAPDTEGETDARPSAISEGIYTRTVLGSRVLLPFDRLAALQLERNTRYARAAELFRAALAARLPGYDVLVTRSVPEPQSLRGRLVSFDGEGGLFVFGDRSRRFRADKLYGIVFATGASRAEVAPHPITVTFADGSVVSGQVVHPEVCPSEDTDAVLHTTDGLCVATSLGVAAAIPLSNVVDVRIRSTRVVYVSTLSPLHEQVDGLLHGRVAGRTPWAVRFDQSVIGGPLAIAGRRFDSGLGVHSRTELTYEIGGAYETFVVTIGLDDAVRPRGSVVFRVLGGKTSGQASTVLFDSGVVTGADPPRDVIVDVSGITLLTLVVDYGNDLDLADAAVWGDARLLKPRTQDDGDTP